MRILTIDVGGTNVKMLVSGKREPRKIASGRSMTAAAMVKAVEELVADWSYDAVSIGFPGPVVHGRIANDPVNLGGGWTGFDFQKAFHRPVKIINDAAMQALGSYHGGRMLFLGLGTGLGATMIVDGKIEPMEIAHLPFRKGHTYEDYVGLRGLKRLGKRKWRKRVREAIDLLKNALEPDYLVLGGGNAKKLSRLKRRETLGSNANAFEGGFRLWKGVKSARPVRRGAQPAAPG